MTAPDRRQFLSRLSGTFASVAVAGCGGGKTDATATSPTSSLPTASPPPGPVAAPPPPAPVPAPPPLPVYGNYTMADFERETGLHYGFSGVSDAQLAALPQSYPEPKIPSASNPGADGSCGDINTYMGSTGGRGEIGIIPDRSVLAVISNFAPRAAGNIVAVAETSKYWPIHRYDATTNAPIVFGAHPNTSIQSSTRGDYNVTDDPASKHGFSPDIAHQPGFQYVAYLWCRKQTDSYYQAKAAFLLNEMKAWVTWNYLNNTDNARKFENGIFNPQAGANQLRGAGWGFMRLVQLCSVLPTTDPMYAGVKNAVEQNAAYYRGKFIDGTWDETYGLPYYAHTPTQFVNSIGVFSLDNSYDFGDGLARIGAFMQAFVVQSWGAASKLYDAGNLPISDAAHANLVAVRNFGYSYIVGTFGDGATGHMDYRRAGRYSVAVGFLDATVPGGVRVFRDFAEMAANNEASLPALPADNVLRYHDSNSAADEGIAGGYYANAWPALVQAVDDNYPGARAALTRMQNSQQYQAKKYPDLQFALLPKGEYFA